jgi:glycosyltransferase involved in cell wall biosynthesis
MQGGTMLVSIVLTTLNIARYVRETMDSCLAQTYRNLELIVVDGGSTDGTLDIVAATTDPRVRLVHQPNNAGKLAGAINLGLDNARGEYLTWMQADCTYHPTAIETMVNQLAAHPMIGQVYADYWEIDETSAVLRVTPMREPEEFLSVIGDPAGVCFLIRRAVREAIGPHDLTTYPSQDYDYRMRIALQFQSLHLKQPLYYYRVRRTSLTGQLGWPLLARKDVETRQKLGLCDAQQECRLLAEIDMSEAFENYQRQQFRGVPRLVWSGIRRDVRYARNRGVWAILVKSLWRQTVQKTHAKG